MDIKGLVFGGVSGAVSAFLVDLHAWSEAPDGASFNWKKAAARWLAGAVSGALAAAGLHLAV